MAHWHGAASTELFILWPNDSRSSILPVYKVQILGDKARVGSVERYIGEDWVKYNTNEGKNIQHGTPEF